MDNNLQEVTTMVGNLRNMAVDVGGEIDRQNRQLDHMMQKVESPFHYSLGWLNDRFIINTAAAPGFRFGEGHFRGSASSGSGGGATPPDAGEISKIFKKFLRK